MTIGDVDELAFAMPLRSPSYPRGPIATVAASIRPSTLAKSSMIILRRKQRLSQPYPSASHFHISLKE